MTLLEGKFLFSTISLTVRESPRAAMTLTSAAFTNSTRTEEKAENAKTVFRFQDKLFSFSVICRNQFVYMCR